MQFLPSAEQPQIQISKSSVIKQFLSYMFHTLSVLMRWWMWLVASGAAHVFVLVCIRAKSFNAFDARCMHTNRICTFYYHVLMFGSIAFAVIDLHRIHYASRGLRTKVKLVINSDVKQNSWRRTGSDAPSRGLCSLLGNIMWIRESYSEP